MFCHSLVSQSIKIWEKLCQPDGEENNISQLEEVKCQIVPSLPEPLELN